MKLFDVNYLSDSIDGKIKGNDDFKFPFTGRFTFLNNAEKGDIVIRHWINGKGIEIADSKDVSCLITQNPKDGAIEKAEELNFPLIVVDKIEIANAFALKYTISMFSPDSRNIVITGTNGKSTTSHLIYHILNNADYNVFTNTDSESEFNTLIDPMVSELIANEVEKKGELDFLVVEISEVQGWLGALMKNHAYLMADAISPEVGVITNIAMDHIGLVNSVDEVFDEIQAVPPAIKNTLVLNNDDELVKSLKTDKNKFYFSMIADNGDVYYDDGIYYRDEKILDNSELPFTSKHFIQNILAAVGCCISLNISLDEIKNGVMSYKALNRRFSKLNDKPLIIDDFAHNPDGIKATISESLKLLEDNQKLFVACSIRGSRGIEINELNAQALADSHSPDINLIISSSVDVVDDLNFVEDKERETFFNILDDNNIDFIHFDNLVDSLNHVLDNAGENDVVLLIGAQGMDPAESILKELL